MALTDRLVLMVRRVRSAHHLDHLDLKFHQGPWHRQHQPRPTVHLDPLRTLAPRVPMDLMGPKGQTSLMDHLGQWFQRRRLCSKDRAC
jgi:hypothetical protein